MFRHPSGEPDAPYAAQARYFLDCLVSGEAPERSTVDGAILALRVALAARRSLAEGGPVRP